MRCEAIRVVSLGLAFFFGISKIWSQTVVFNYVVSGSILSNSILYRDTISGLEAFRGASAT